jgi:uncharacterized Zn-finger protein
MPIPYLVTDYVGPAPDYPSALPEPAHPEWAYWPNPQHEDAFPFHVVPAKAQPASQHDAMSPFHTTSESGSSEFSKADAKMRSLVSTQTPSSLSVTQDDGSQITSGFSLQSHPVFHPSSGWSHFVPQDWQEFQLDHVQAQGHPTQGQVPYSDHGERASMHSASCLGSFGQPQPLSFAATPNVVDPASLYPSPELGTHPSAPPMDQHGYFQKAQGLQSPVAPAGAAWAFQSYASAGMDAHHPLAMTSNMSSEGIPTSFPSVLMSPAPTYTSSYPSPAPGTLSPPKKPIKHVHCLWFRCSATFTDVAELVPHLMTAHIPRNYNRGNMCKWGGAQCSISGSCTYDSTESLIQHLMESHIKLLAQRQLAPPSMYGMTVSMDQDTTTPHQLHACCWKGCEARFTNFTSLTEHVSRVHVGTRKESYVCEWQDCARQGRPFTQRQKCIRHIQVHTGDKPFMCTVCSRRFSELSVLMIHMRAHYGDKPFQCDHPGCGKRFTIASALTIHQRTHSGIKPFACPQCDRRFTESSNLIKHIRTHTGVRPFQCPECLRKFARSDQVARHMKVHRKHQANAGSHHHPDRLALTS